MQILSSFLPSPTIIASTTITPTPIQIQTRIPAPLLPHYTVHHHPPLLSTALAPHTAILMELVKSPKVLIPTTIVDTLESALSIQ